MRSEIPFLGLYLPGLLLCAIIASVLWFIVDGVMLRSGGYRFFWHPPLARLALYFALLGLTVALIPEF